MSWITHKIISPVGLVLVSFFACVAIGEAPDFLSQFRDADPPPSAPARGHGTPGAREQRTLHDTIEYEPRGALVAGQARREAVLAMLAAGADVNARDPNGMTPLHRAASASTPDIVELLIARGADVTARDDNGKTPLHYAMTSANAVVLLTHGADPNAVAKFDDTPLLNAMRNSAKGIDFVRVLLERGAHADGVAPHHGAPLLRAVSDGDLEMVRLLLAHGGDVDAGFLGPYNSSALTTLHIAARNGRADIADLLLGAGADVRAANTNGWTALHYSASRCNDRLARLLLRHGADPAARDRLGKTPMPCYPFAFRPPEAPAMLFSCR